MTWLLIGAALVGAGRLIYALLGEAVARGVGRDHGLDVAAQVMAQANALRGSGSPDDKTWDGRNRLGRVGLLP